MNVQKKILVEEITQLKIYLEEAKLTKEVLKKQVLEKERHYENLELEIVGLRQELEKTRALNFIFAKGSDTLEEIIKVKCSPLIKTGLEYNSNGETSKSLKYSKICTRSHTNAIKGNNNQNYSSQQNNEGSNHFHVKQPYHNQRERY